MLLKISLNAKGNRLPYCCHQSLPYEPAVLAHNLFRYSSLFITFIAFNQRGGEKERQGDICDVLQALCKIPASNTSIIELCVPDLIKISYYSPLDILTRTWNTIWNYIAVGEDAVFQLSSAEPRGAEVSGKLAIKFKWASLPQCFHKVPCRSKAYCSLTRVIYMRLICNHVASYLLVCQTLPPLTRFYPQFK